MNEQEQEFQSIRLALGMVAPEDVEDIERRLRAAGRAPDARGRWRRARRAEPPPMSGEIETHE